MWIGGQDIKNIIRKYKQELQNGRTPIEALCAHLRSKDIILEAMFDDKMNRLTHLFFQPAACAALTHMYGIPLFMDCTYKTDLYNMPLMPVSSVTGTDDTFSSSFAFLRNEKICEYRWALTQITRNLAGKYPPAVVVIDHENALIREYE